jgi:hypothetical protein
LIFEVTFIFSITIFLTIDFNSLIHIFTCLLIYLNFVICYYLYSSCSYYLYFIFLTFIITVLNYLLLVILSSTKSYNIFTISFKWFLCSYNYFFCPYKSSIFLRHIINCDLYYSPISIFFFYSILFIIFTSNLSISPLQFINQFLLFRFTLFSVLIKYLLYLLIYSL